MDKNVSMHDYKDIWAKVAKEEVDWIRPWKTVHSGGFAKGDVRWFEEGQLNVSANCLDRHLETKGNQAALIWEGDEECQQRSYTFSQLHHSVCKMANALKHLGIKKGDRVGIYMPMIPEAIMAMLACTRIGAVHAVVFAGFSPQSLRQRLEAADCRLLITADSYQRGGKSFALKQQADTACEGLDITTLIVRNDNIPIHFEDDHEYWWHELEEQMSADCPPEPMNAEDPLFILYTSGSTGQPKGLLHTTGGYLVQTAFTFHHIFDVKPHEIFWCTADIGWVTGHTYVTYGPLSKGVTTLIHAGVPNWPDPARHWRMIDRHRVNVYYTAPTAIRALMRAGNEWLDTTHRDSLRLLGSVGEPINPEVWRWYQQKVGRGHCAIVDTWWQTETGAMMICPQPPFSKDKPGAACQPIPGVFPALLDEEMKEVKGEGIGYLAIKQPWPAMARSIANDHERYLQTYFKNGYYITGDGAHRDEDGDWWITGRVDDVLNVSGHRLGSAEIESALVAHKLVSEAAVVGMHHDVKGECVVAFVSLKRGMQSGLKLLEELKATVKEQIGALARPEEVVWVSDLPKTRSGKIMRRILRKIVNGEVSSMADLGDLSTLSNPTVVEDIMQQWEGQMCESVSATGENH